MLRRRQNLTKKIRLKLERRHGKLRAKCHKRQEFLLLTEGIIIKQNLIFVIPYDNVRLYLYLQENDTLFILMILSLNCFSENVFYKIISCKMISYKMISYKMIPCKIISYKMIFFKMISYKMLCYKIISHKMFSYKQFS